MTGPERTDFHALRGEIREGFHEINEKLDKVIGRVSSLENTRSRQEGAADAERRISTRSTQERRWRVGLLLGVAASAAMGVLNLLVGK